MEFREKKDDTILLKIVNRLYFSVSMLATGGEVSGMEPQTLKTKLLSMILSFIALGGFIALLFNLKWEKK